MIPRTPKRSEKWLERNRAALEAAGLIALAESAVGDIGLIYLNKNSGAIESIRARYIPRIEKAEAACAAVMNG